MAINRRKHSSDDADPAIDYGLIIETYNATGDTVHRDRVFELFIEHDYSRAVDSVTFKLNLGRDRHLAEVAVDDAIAQLIKLLQNRDFKHPNVLGWIIEAARRYGMQARRKTKRIDDKNDFDDLDASQILVPDDDPDDDEGGGGASLTPDQEERLEIINCVLSRLDPRKKAIMERWVDTIDGSVNAREVAAEFGVSHDAVRQLACRMRNKITSLYQGGGSE